MLVLLDGEGLYECHTGQIIVQVRQSEGVRPRVLDSALGVRYASTDSSERLLIALLDREELLISHKASSGLLLLVDRPELVPTLIWAS
jgi:hypothetical protein